MEDASSAPARRRWFTGAAGTLGMAAGLAAPPAAAAPAPRIARTRFALAADFMPVTDRVNIVPWRTVLVDDGLGCTADPDGTIVVSQAGLYQIVFACDWVAQAGTDIDLRKIGIRRRRVGAKPPHPFQAIDKRDDHLASADTPGSDPPRMARAQVAWEPGLVPLGGLVHVDATVTPPGIVDPGDLALASHTAIADATIGEAAAAAIVVQAKVVGPDRVRATLYNPAVAEGIRVPAGMLNVLAMSARAHRGESTDAWQMLRTATEPIAAGERIYAVVRSRVPGDYLQALKTCFLQIERIG